MFLILENEQQCYLIPGIFGICVQASLALTSFTVLLIKYRFLERPRRTLQDFGRDVGKLACGGALVHIFNLLASTFLFRASGSADPCDWYFVNVLLDSTLGVGINWYLLRLSQIYLNYTSGDYYEEANEGSGEFLFEEEHDRRGSSGWEKQAIVWLGIVFIMKCCITIVMLLFHKPLGNLSHSIFSSMGDEPHRKLLVVMVFAPLLLSAFQYAVTDSFLKLSPRRIKQKRSLQEKQHVDVA